eukprot:s3018_g14.t1
MRISAVHHMIAGVIPACKWLASIVGVDEVLGKDGTKIDVDVNAEEGELDQEMRLSEPLPWESEFPPEAERRGIMKEMDSMRNFEVYDEVKVDDCTQEQIDGALDCRCFQNVEKSEEDNLFASTPSLVTMRLLLCMALARNWGITMGDVSTAFLHALMNEEVFEVLLKETGQLVPGSEHTFLGRRLRHNGDSIDVRMSQKYIDAILELYGMKDAKPVATTGTVTINKTVPDTPLSPEEHKVYRTAMVGTGSR